MEWNWRKNEERKIAKDLAAIKALSQMQNVFAFVSRGCTVIGHDGFECWVCAYIQLQRQRRRQRRPTTTTDLKWKNNFFRFTLALFKSSRCFRVCVCAFFLFASFSYLYLWIFSCNCFAHYPTNPACFSASLVRERPRCNIIMYNTHVIVV